MLTENYLLEFFFFLKNYSLLHLFVFKLFRSFHFLKLLVHLIKKNSLKRNKKYKRSSSSGTNLERVFGEKITEVVVNSDEPCLVYRKTDNKGDDFSKAPTDQVES